MPITYCDALNGIIISCADKGIGGIETVYLVNSDRVLSVTETATHTISAITLSAGTSFQEFKPNRDSSTFTDPMTNDITKGVVSYSPTLSLVFSKTDQTKRNELMLVADSNVKAIVKDNNGIYWYAGLRFGLDMTSGGIEAGTAKTDMNGIKFELKGTGEPNPVTQVEATCIVALGL